MQFHELQPTTAQVNGEGGKPPLYKSEETEETDAHDGNKKKDDEEPKSKPHPSRTKVRTWNPYEKVDLATGKSGIEAEEPITIGQLFMDAVDRFPKHPALKYKEDGKWKAITYTDYYDLCIKAAKSFLKVRVGAACVYLNYYSRIDPINVPDVNMSLL